MSVTENDLMPGKQVVIDHTVWNVACWMSSASERDVHLSRDCGQTLMRLPWSDVMQVAMPYRVPRRLRRKRNA